MLIASTTAGSRCQRADVAGVAAALGALSDDVVDAGLCRRDRPPHRAGQRDHLHPALVAGVDQVLRHVERQRDHRRTLLIDHRELILHRPRRQHRLDALQLHPLGGREPLPQLADRLPLVVIRAQQHVGNEQIDSERLVGAAADLADLRPQRVGHVADASEAAHAAGFRDRDHQVRLRHPGHSGRQHGMLDPEPVGERRSQHRLGATPSPLPAGRRRGRAAHGDSA